MPTSENLDRHSPIKEMINECVKRTATPFQRYFDPKKMIEIRQKCTEEIMGIIRSTDNPRD